MAPASPPPAIPARRAAKGKATAAPKRRSSTASPRYVQSKIVRKAATAKLTDQMIDSARHPRTARLGRDTWLHVTFTSVDEGVPLAFGADRTLLGWIQTHAVDDGFVSFETVTEFCRAFGLSDSGREYLRFRERLRRIESLAIRIRYETSQDLGSLHLRPILASFTPRSSRALREQPAGEAHQLVLLRIPGRYGFQLDPTFHEYLQENKVPLPLPLMRLFKNSPQAWAFASLRPESPATSPRRRSGAGRGPRATSRGRRGAAAGCRSRGGGRETPDRGRCGHRGPPRATRRCPPAPAARPPEPPVGAPLGSIDGSALSSARNSSNSTAEPTWSIVAPSRSAGKTPPRSSAAVAAISCSRRPGTSPAICRSTTGAKSLRAEAAASGIPLRFLTRGAHGNPVGLAEQFSLHPARSHL